ncbi:thymosin beta-like [Limulus polyphemus]|uniref:Thymosin beta-like n=1 Tax=Limulus polyphemus TaxID=6850 RepID=A0ABM1BIN4_LIMPO|nr:thymosin beta-like [Limulus polyphemus]
MIEGVENFNRSALKQTNTEEKSVLPTKEEIILEKGQQELLKNIQSYNPSNLRPTETVEKNPLPTKDVIELEKSAA